MQEKIVVVLKKVDSAVSKIGTKVLQLPFGEMRQEDTLELLRLWLNRIVYRCSSQQVIISFLTKRSKTMPSFGRRKEMVFITKLHGRS